MMKSHFRPANRSLILTLAGLAGVAQCRGDDLFEFPASSLASTIILASAKNAHAAELSVEPGGYRVAGGTVYVGIEAEPPGHPEIQYYDPETRRIGTLERVSGRKYRTDDSLKISFVLDSPTYRVAEKPFVVEQGPISWAPRCGKRSEPREGRQFY